MMLSTLGKRRNATRERSSPITVGLQADAFLRHAVQPLRHRVATVTYGFSFLCHNHSLREWRTRSANLSILSVRRAPMPPNRKPLEELAVDLLLETFEEHRYN
jgi:hypothetical protein